MDNLPQKQSSDERQPVKVVEKEHYSNLSILQENLNHCLTIIDDELMKGYLDRLESLPVIPYEDISNGTNTKPYFFKITQLVYQKDEFSVDKFATVFHTLSDRNCSVVLVIDSKGIRNDFYLGVRSNDENRSTSTLREMLEQSLHGLFPGTQTERVPGKIQKILDNSKIGCISSVSCIADFKQKKDRVNEAEFIQGLEKFVNSMRGHTYTAVFLADSVAPNDLVNQRLTYENIYSQISPFANMQMNFGEQSSRSSGTTKSIGKGLSDSLTKNESLSLSNTQGSSISHSEGETISKTKTRGTTDSTANTTGKTKTVSNGTFNSITSSSSVSVGIGAPSGGPFASASQSISLSHGNSHSESIANNVSRTLSHGISNSESKGISLSHGTVTGTSYQEGSTVASGTSTTSGRSINYVDATALSDTFGNSQAITLNGQNRVLLDTLKRIDHQLERIDECEGIGMWNFSAYFIGEELFETEMAADTYESLITGVGSGVQRAAINTWIDDNNVQEVGKYIRNFSQPKFLYQGFSYDGVRETVVSPAVLVSTEELAIQMGLPRHSVNGLPVVEHAVFGQEVVNTHEMNDSLCLGKIYHLGNKFENDVKLDLKSLTMHTFITGSTGSGKSNAIYHILEEIKKKDIPFLVVEPAKGEYKRVFQDVPCYGTNPMMGEILRINPFAFPAGIHVLEHVDRIIEIFNVCWPMYAAMPAVLKDAIVRSYEDAGWDLEYSENSISPYLFPTFQDVFMELHKVMKQSDYSDDTKGDYIGSLSTRLRSLTNGLNGMLFSANEMDLAKLFDSSALIDLSRVGSSETKALIMGFLVLKLQEYRIANAKIMNSPLKHITVLEEAHNILRKTSTDQSEDSANLAGKSVEMLTNIIAEIRTYGEGFIIADQAPNLLDTAVIRNTNTKVVLRLPEGEDRETLGKSMALSREQTREISKLPVGVAAVFQNNWQETVLCQIPEYHDHYSMLKGLPVHESGHKKDDMIIKILHGLLDDSLDEIDAQGIISDILKVDCSASLRKGLIKFIRVGGGDFDENVEEFIKSNFKFSDIYKGTSIDKPTTSQLLEIMVNNLRPEFTDFSDTEIKHIIFYICHLEHQNHPENQTIEYFGSRKIWG